MLKTICSTAIFAALTASFTCFANEQVYIEVAEDNLCEEFGIGWANYCDPTIVVEAEEEKPQPKIPAITIIQSAPQSAPPKDPNDPLVWLENYQKEEKRARARMVMEPSQENIDAYRKEFFNDTMDRGTLVSDFWRRSAWQNPDNDYTLKRPTGYLSKREHDLRRDETLANTAKSLNERYGVFFVFDPSDSISAKAGTVIDSFASTYGMYIRGISLSGEAMPTWNRPWMAADENVIDKLKINDKYHTAFILFDSKTHETIPIGYGLLAQDELLNRIYILTQVKPGEDY